MDLAKLQLGDHPFGTDRLGRDVYSRVILGANSIFRIAGLGTLISVLLGSALGLFMGYHGGWVDEILGRVIDALLAIPALLLALVLVGLIRNLDFAAGSWQAGLADNVVLLVIAVLYIPVVARVARSTTLDIKTREFVEAAEIRGESQAYIIFREILPSVIPSLVVEASLALLLRHFSGRLAGFPRLWRPPALARLGADGQRKSRRLLPTHALGVGVSGPRHRHTRHRRKSHVRRHPPRRAEGRLAVSANERHLLDVDKLTISYRVGKRWIPAVRDFRLQLQPGRNCRLGR